MRKKLTQLRLGNSNSNSGFTLIELLIVIGILAVLLSITLLAINPARQFAQANNTKRQSDTVALLNAIDQYIIDNKGVLPTQITTTVQHISNTGADLCTILMGGTVHYLPSLPRDPKVTGGSITTCVGAYDTGFTVVKDATNRITVATDPANEELSVHVSITR